MHHRSTLANSDLGECVFLCLCVCMCCVWVSCQDVVTCSSSLWSSPLTMLPSLDDDLRGRWNRQVWVNKKNLTPKHIIARDNIYVYIQNIIWPYNSNFILIFLTYWPVTKRMAPLQWTQHPQLAFYSQRIDRHFSHEKVPIMQSKLYSPTGSQAAALWEWNFFFILNHWRRKLYKIVLILCSFLFARHDRKWAIFKF